MVSVKKSQYSVYILYVLIYGTTCKIIYEKSSNNKLTSRPLEITTKAVDSLVVVLKLCVMT